jgi:hypothetical protein
LLTEKKQPYDLKHNVTGYVIKSLLDYRVLYIYFKDIYSFCDFTSQDLKKKLYFETLHNNLISRCEEQTS